MTTNDGEGQPPSYFQRSMDAPETENDSLEVTQSNTNSALKDQPQEATTNQLTSSATVTSSTETKLFDRLATWRQKANLQAQQLLTKRTTWLQQASLSPANNERTTKVDTQQQVQEEEDEEESVFSSEYYNDDASSVYSSSIFSGGTSDAAPTLHWAAGAVVDSVQSGYYRGRYNTNASTTSTTSSNNRSSHKISTSQTTRILQNAQYASHLQQLMQDLQSHQYIMLLGKGMLGVNLKQSFRRNQGVYVDYLVEKGAAEQSACIRVGDLMVSVGSRNVEHSTITHVPQLIANSKRPVHLVLATGDPHINNYIDVACAMAHMLTTTKEVVTMKKESNRDVNNQLDDDDDDSSVQGETGDENDVEMELVQPTSFDAQEEEAAEIQEKSLQGEIPPVTHLLDPEPPSQSMAQAYQAQAAKRCNDLDFDQVVQITEPSFWTACRHSLLLCLADARRFPFLARCFQQDPQLSATLMLALELYVFCDLYDITPPYRRAEITTKLAYKYFLPTAVGTELVPPLFDFHGIVSDSTLRDLEHILNDSEMSTNRDLFVEFCNAAWWDLLAREPMVRFLVSDECARMRAYLRQTAPYRNLSLYTIVTQANSSYHWKRVWVYIMVYLLCQTDREIIGEHDDILGESKGHRIGDAAHGMCGVYFLRFHLLPLLESPSSSDEAVITAVSQFWEIFAAPGVGMLHHQVSKHNHSSEAADHLIAVRAHLGNIVNSTKDPREWAAHLRSPELMAGLSDLANELVYHYATQAHTKFRSHKCYEWMMHEMEDCGELPSGCVKRLLRKVDFPKGVSVHKPTHEEPTARTEEAKASTLEDVSAECAVIFGTAVGLDINLSAGKDPSDIRRYTCVSLSETSTQIADLLPPTLEDYASTPVPANPKPFADTHRTLSCSVDGWEVSLVNFIVPRADGNDQDEDSSIYGVSLLFQRRTVEMGERIPTRLVQDDAIIRGEPMVYFEHADEDSDDPDHSRIVRVTDDPTEFNKKMSMRPWSVRVTKQVRHDDDPITIGIALVAQRNVILSMREALTYLFWDFCQSPTGTTDSSLCTGLADILGNFAHAEISPNLLKSILRPYVTYTAKPWLERPLNAQRHAFLDIAGQQLIQSLTPVPLALLFIACLLEQKVVLTSSRRSILMSATTALTELLQPLKWCHLLVPRVPASLAGDLLQYPAPFILGFPSEDPGILDLIRDLPSDVTLVDLDVGRVILAPSFCHTSDLSRPDDKDEDATRAALRSQVLYLAQSLGTAFGEAICPHVWCCDRVDRRDSVMPPAPFESLKATCCEFVQELLAGSTACCYWIQEPGDGIEKEPTILFDEDWFFHVKRRRYDGYHALFETNRVSSSSVLSLNVSDFDLILQVWLRCQGVNAYISTHSHHDMAFAIE